MALSQPLLLAAVLGLTSTVSHMKRGSHIPPMHSIVENPELSPLDMAYLYITWKIVWVMMLAVSLAQLYLALPTSHDASTVAVRTVILRIFALAWLANGIVFVKGVGVRELPPWISIACSALVWLGSLRRLNNCDISPKAVNVTVVKAEVEEPPDEGHEGSQHKKRTHRGKRGGKKSKGAKKAGQDIDEAGE